MISTVNKIPHNKCEYTSRRGLTVAEAVSRWPPTAAAQVHTWVWQVGFVVDKVASGQVFSENFGFPCQNRSTPSSQSPGTGTIGQEWPQCRVDPVWTPTPNIKKNTSHNK
jgi:hypothetical protein